MKYVAFGMLLVSLLVAGCRQDMEKQPKLDTMAAAPAFARGAAARTLPAGVVSRHQQTAREALIPPRVDAALLGRGQERFDIFCSACHGKDGYGNGMVVQRGFPHPPSFHSAELRAAPPRHIFDVITHGHGVMYSYADRVPPRDRWAIVAYIRALQLSQQATLAEAPEAREKLP